MYQEKDDLLPAPATLSSEEQEVEKRMRLLALFKHESANLKQVLEDFDALSGVQRKERLDACDSILDICDRVLSDKGWYTSRFLKSVIEPIEKQRAAMQSLRRELILDDTQVQVKKPEIDSEGKCVVYLLLFHREGLEMKNWENLLMHLDRYCLGRPVYSKEEEARAFVRSKENQSREAYVKVYVDESMIVSSDFGQRKDRLGQPLLTLAQGAIRVDQVEQLVHLNKPYYFYKQKELVVCSDQ